MRGSFRGILAAGFNIVPFDLVLTIGGAVVAYGFVLTNPGYRAAAEPLTIDIYNLTITLTVPTLLGTIAGLILLLFLPGYAFIAAVFPNRGSGSTTVNQIGPSLSVSERLALSGAMGIVTAATTGLLIGWTPLEFSRQSAGLLITILVIVIGFVGTIRGHISLVEYRPINPLKQLKGKDINRDRAASVLLTLSIVVAFGALSIGMVMPNPGESFTGFSVLTETNDGAEVAAAYPANLTQYESVSFELMVENQELEAVPYTIVVEEERVSRGAEGVEVVADNELGRMSVDVDTGATETREISLTPTMSGTDLRLTFYLYRGDPPADPSTETAYRFLYIWTDVEPATGENGSS